MTQAQKDTSMGLAITLILWMIVGIVGIPFAYHLGQQAARKKTASIQTTCEKAIEINDKQRLAMTCLNGILWVWNRETGEFVGAVNFGKAQ